MGEHGKDRRGKLRRGRKVRGTAEAVFCKMKDLGMTLTALEDGTWKNDY